MEARAVARLATLDARLRSDPDRPVDEIVSEGRGESRRWHRIRKVAVPDGADPCRYVLTLAEEVTERYRMIAQLRRSEASLKRSQAIARLGSWRWLAGSQALEASEELHRLLGRPSGSGTLPVRALLRAVPAEDRRRRDRGRAAIRNVFRATGAREVIEGGVAIGLHLMGGCTLGVDPATSVTGPDFRLHGFDNIYAADSSVFPNAPGINPSFTIMALAAMAGARIAQDVRA